MSTELTDAPVMGWTHAVFERIGRTGTTPKAALTVELPEEVREDADALAEMLFDHCRRYLVSGQFSVSVDLRQGQVWIAGGRFGGGKLERRPAES